MHARGSSIIVPTRYSRVSLSSCAVATVIAAQPVQLLGEADQRVHDLDERRVARALLAPPARRARSPAPASRRSRARAARAGSRACRASGSSPCSALIRSRIRSSRGLLERREELVQRWVEQPDRHRQARHRLEDALEVGLLMREQPVERGAPLVLARGHDHLPHDGQPVVRHEHVLGAAEADPLGAEVARLGGIVRGVGVCTHLQPAQARRPSRGSSRSPR